MTPEPSKQPRSIQQILASSTASTNPVDTTSATGRTEAAKALKYLTNYQTPDKNLTELRNAAAEFIARMWDQQNPYTLSILGPNGLGKTFLAKQVLSFFNLKMRDKKQDPQFKDGIWRCQGGLVNWGDTLGDMISTRDFSRVSAFKHDFFLILDDITAESGKMRESSASKLFSILESRQGKRWTIVTANVDLDGINELLDPRISSRLIRDQNVCISLPPDTPDFALRKR